MEYVKASLEVTEFEVEDVITTSGGTNVTGPEDPWGDDGGGDFSED